jgi:hypothetical protein
MRVGGDGRDSGHRPRRESENEQGNSISGLTGEERVECRSEQFRSYKLEKIC